MDQELDSPLSVLAPVAVSDRALLVDLSVLAPVAVSDRALLVDLSVLAPVAVSDRALLVDLSVLAPVAVSDRALLVDLSVLAPVAVSDRALLVDLSVLAPVAALDLEQVVPRPRCSRRDGTGRAELALLGTVRETRNQSRRVLRRSSTKVDRRTKGPIAAVGIGAFSFVRRLCSWSYHKCDRWDCCYRRTGPAPAERAAPQSLPTEGP